MRRGAPILEDLLGGQVAAADGPFHRGGPTGAGPVAGQEEVAHRRALGGTQGVDARPDAELFFITGADAIEQILTWKDADELWKMAHFVAVSRPGHQLSVDGLPPGVVTTLEVPALAISSTDCRRRAEAGQPVWYLVPDGVVQYIAKHGLYRGQHDE